MFCKQKENDDTEKDTETIQYPVGILEIKHAGVIYFYPTHHLSPYCKTSEKLVLNDEGEYCVNLSFHKYCVLKKGMEIGTLIFVPDSLYIVTEVEYQLPGGRVWILPSGNQVGKKKGEIVALGPGKTYYVLVEGEANPVYFPACRLYPREC